jgi:hypothetical protein
MWNQDSLRLSAERDHEFCLVRNCYKGLYSEVARKLDLLSDSG